MNETESPTIEVRKLAGLIILIGGAVLAVMGFKGAYDGPGDSSQPASITQLADGEAVPVFSIRNALDAEGLGAHHQWATDQNLSDAATSICYVSALDSWGPYDALDFATTIYNEDVATGYWSMEVFGGVPSYANAVYTIMDVACPGELDALMAR